MLTLKDIREASKNIREASTMEENFLVLKGKVCVVSFFRTNDGFQHATISDKCGAHCIDVRSHLDSDFFEKNVLRAIREFGEEVEQ